MIDKRLDWNSFHPFNSLETPSYYINNIYFLEISYYHRIFFFSTGRSIARRLDTISRCCSFSNFVTLKLVPLSSGQISFNGEGLAPKEFG